MRVLQGVKKFLKPLADIPTWMGYRTLVDNGKSVIKSVKDIYTPSKAERTETFAQAKARLQLTEEDLKKQESAFFLLALFWFVVALGLLVYTFWLFLHGGFISGLFGLSLVFLSSILTFRYHFWYFQTKSRTLGLTFKQWLKACLGDKK
jgi:intracellular multiplication protein IcmV